MWNGDKLKVSIGLIFLISFSRLVLCEYDEPNFIGEVPWEIEGVTVNEDGRSITVNENREIGDETNQLIAVLRYSGPTPPMIKSYLPSTPHQPNLTIIEREEAYYIKIENELNYENGDTLSWAVELDPSPSGLFSILVADINDISPVFTGYPTAPIQVTEKLIPEDALFRFEAEDEDTVDKELRFTLEDLQNGDDTPFVIDPTTGELSLVKALDYQLQTSYRLQISVSDSDNIHTVKAPMVTNVEVVDTPDLPPKWIRFSYRLEITENNKLDDTLYEYVAVDDDSGINSPIRYELKNGNPYLEIDQDSGILKPAVIFDAETAPESFEFNVVAKEVDDPFKEIDEVVVLIVKDLNDNPPLFQDGTPSKEFVITISENTIGSLPSLEDLVITDIDKSLKNSAFEARIVGKDEETELWLNSAFVVSPSSGYSGGPFSLLIQPNATIDYEDEKWRQKIEFSVRVEETADPGQHADGIIKLTVQDVNDNSPEFEDVSEDGAVEFPLFENVNGSVGAIKALDKDFSEKFGTSSIRYKWSRTNPSKLDLNSETGEITVCTPDAFDRERTDVEEYIVEAGDSLGDAESRKTTTVLRFLIQDVNDEPPLIRLPTASIQIPENQDGGSGPILEGIEISDPDEDTELKVECEVVGSPETKNWFICETEGDNPMVVSISIGSEKPDYEVTSRVDISIVVTDLKTEVGYPNSTTSFIAVNIEDVNDEPPVFETPQSISVYETAECTPPEGEDDCQDENQREIYRFRATDKDTSPEDFRFNMTSDYEGMLDLVSIGTLDGVLRRNPGKMIDREISCCGSEITEKLYYKLTVFNVDNEDLADTLEVEVEIVDINDNFPVFLPVPTDFVVSEGDEGVGTKIFHFKASDKDGGRFGQIEFRLDADYNGGIGLDKFEIEPDTGILKVSSPIDRESIQSYTLRVIAKDNVGSISNANEATSPIITITVKDVNDNQPEFSNPSFSPLKEDAVQEGTILGQVTVTDADEPGNNNSIIDVELVDVVANCRNCDGMIWQDFFKGEFDASTNMFTVRAVVPFLTYYGTFALKIHAKDRGDEVVLENEDIFELKIEDVNDNAPVITSPEEDTVVYVKENLEVGSILVEWNNDLVPELAATDADDPTIGNGVVGFSLRPGTDAFIYFKIVSSSGKTYLAVKSQLVENHEPIPVEIVARDEADEPKETTRIMSVIVVPSVNKPPFFTNSELVVQFTENENNEIDSLEDAIDPDTVGEEGNIFGEVICYFIIQGDLSDSFVLNVSTNELSLGKALDREEFAEYELVIMAKNDKPEMCRLPPPPYDLNSSNILRVNVEVRDVKDTAPVFLNPGPIIAGGIRAPTAMAGSSTSIILRVTDPDLNDPVTVTINHDSLFRSDASLSSIRAPVFELSSDNEILTTFQANEAMKGYFGFLVNVQDSVGMNSEAECKVFFTTEAHEADFKFNNDEEVFTPEILDEVVTILSSVYNFRCNIDNKGPTVDENGNPLAGKTTVKTHFIDDVQSEPVPSYLITNLPYDDPGRFVNLTSELKRIGLDLDIQSYYEETEPEESNLLTYVFIGAIGVLAILVATISIAFWYNARKLSLRVRALKASAIESEKSLGPPRSGFLELPNTNQHAIQGSNPIWTTHSSQRNFDSDSVGSGGSILIGVENDDDFKNYREGGGKDEFQFAFGSQNPLFEAGESSTDGNLNQESVHSSVTRNPLLLLND